MLVDLAFWLRQRNRLNARSQDAEMRLVGMRLAANSAQSQS